MLSFIMYRVLYSDTYTAEGAVYAIAHIYTVAPSYISTNQKDDLFFLYAGLHGSFSLSSLSFTQLGWVVLRVSINVSQVR